MSFDPAPLAFLAVAAVLYWRAVRALTGRGWQVPRSQQVLWWSGLALMGVGLLGPLDGLGEELLTAHMAQHLVIADLAAPLLLAGLRTPVLQHFLPRSVLVPLAHRQGLRRLFRFLRRPLVALPLWVLTLYGWHFAFMFEGALREPLVHVLQHWSFVAASLLVWWSALEPKRARLPGELWKAGYILGARVAGMFLGMAFVILRDPVYSGFYGDSARAHGLDPLADQQIAGGLMLSLDLAVMLFGLAFFFWRAAADHDLAEHRAAKASG